MNTFRRNVPLLTTCQALMMSGSSLIITTTALVGYGLAQNKSWATLPLAAQFIATMCTTIPASLLMDSIGRKHGFILASLFGISGACFATLAILKGKFSLFALGTLQIGIFNGFGNYYRFAAADAVDKDLKARAVSYIMAGGVVAVPCQRAGGEPLVVTKVEVGLTAVVEHVNFAVLIRAHRSRIHVDVWIQLLHPHTQSALLEQHTD